MKRFLAFLAIGALSLGAVGCDVDVKDTTPDVDVVEVPDAPDVDAPDAPDTNIDITNK